MHGSLSETEYKIIKLGCDRPQERRITMMTLIINRKANTIEMPSKKYAHAASKYGSREYNEVQAARVDNPTYEVITRKTVKKNNNTLKGLTYEVMEKYISNHDENGKIKKQYDFLRGNAEESSCSATYGEIRKWFLKTYPNYGKYPQSASPITVQ